MKIISNKSLAVLLVGLSIQTGASASARPAPVKILDILKSPEEYRSKWAEFGLLKEGDDREFGEGDNKAASVKVYLTNPLVDINDIYKNLKENQNAYVIHEKTKNCSQWSRFWKGYYRLKSWLGLGI